jgi:single-strand DNA-binding protein
MANLNKVMLIGNLTRDPELRYTPKGTAVADISLAINRNWTNDSGQKQEETTFVGVTLWGRQAELAQQYLTKGRPVYIEGRLSQESWDDKETGKKTTKTKVIAEAMQFLGGGQDRSQQGQAAPQQSGAKQQQTKPEDQDFEEIQF